MQSQLQPLPQYHQAGPVYYNQPSASAGIGTPTPSPAKKSPLKQDTLTQNDWGERPIPAGWRECTDGSGNTFYYHKSRNQWAPSYKDIFEQKENEEDKSSPLSSSQELALLKSVTKRSPGPLKKRLPTPPTEIRTQDLPGSDFMERMEIPRKYSDDEDNEPEESDDDRTVEVVEVVPILDDDDEEVTVDDKEEEEEDEQTTW
jgi:hypothetical protein